MHAKVAGLAVATAFGTLLEGGFYAGRIRTPEGEYAIILAPKAAGEHDDIAWNGSREKVAGAMSFYDGRANTLAMAEAGSDLAKWALGLQVSGHSDWYLPSRDELELCYRNLKPTSDENYCYRGDNPSSVPVGYAYMPDAPTQTEISIFRAGGGEAFAETWYWTSTQFAGDSDYAWDQYFSGGYQNHWRKDNEYRARAVRRVLV